MFNINKTENNIQIWDHYTSINLSFEDAKLLIEELDKVLAGELPEPLSAAPVSNECQFTKILDVIKRGTHQRERYKDWENKVIKICKENKNGNAGPYSG
jgi:hypothetical protein